MESSSTTVPSAKKTIRKSSVIILLIPAIIGVLIWNIGHFAYRHGIFYMPPSNITGSTLIFFTVIVVYLKFRLKNLRMASLVAITVGGALLLNLFLYTSYETSKYEPALNISKTFITPEGWVEAKEAGPYQYFGNLWEKHDENSPLVYDDLKNIASANNIKSDGIKNDCEPSASIGGCSLRGYIDGQEVELEYRQSPYEGYESTLSLSIKGHYPPRGYELMPYCSEMDSAGDMRVERICSPVDIFKHNFF